MPTIGFVSTVLSQIQLSHFLWFVKVSMLLTQIADLCMFHKTVSFDKALFG